MVPRVVWGSRREVTQYSCFLNASRVYSFGHEPFTGLLTLYGANERRLEVLGRLHQYQSVTRAHVWFPATYTHLKL